MCTAATWASLVASTTTTLPFILFHGSLFLCCFCLNVTSKCSFDSIGLKEFLKFNSCEFNSFVMKTDKRSWVVTEPGAIEGMRHGVAFFIWIIQNPMLRSRMEMKVSPSTVHIISWFEGSRNGYQSRNRFNMWKSVTNWICLFFFGMAKPCVAHLELLSCEGLQSYTVFWHLSLIGEGVNVGLDMACHDMVWHWDQ